MKEKYFHLSYLSSIADNSAICMEVMIKKLLCLILCFALLISCGKPELDKGIDTIWKIDDLWSFKINHIFENDLRNFHSDKHAEYVFTVAFEYKNIGYGSDENKLIFDKTHIEFYDSNQNILYPYNLYNLSDYYYQPKEIAIRETCNANITFCLKEKIKKVTMKISHEDNNNVQIETEYDINLEYH